MKSDEEIMQILEAFDLTRSFRDAAELSGCSHHTVGDWVAKRDAGLLPAPGEPARRHRIVDPFLPKIEEWVERSNGKVRADVVFDKLRGVGVRRVRPHRPPGGCRRQGLASQGNAPGVSGVDPGAGHVGPVGLGRRAAGHRCWFVVVLRVVVVVSSPGGDPDRSRTLPSLVACLDRLMRSWGGAPTYWLTDNEKPVTVAHVAGIPIRNPNLVAAAAHYGVTVATCVPFDPESKGGSEATVRVAKADLVPTDADLLDEYSSWAELVDACDAPRPEGGVW